MNIYIKFLKEERKFFQRFILYSRQPVQICHQTIYIYVIAWIHSWWNNSSDRELSLSDSKKTQKTKIGMSFHHNLRKAIFQAELMLFGMNIKIERLS